MKFLKLFITVILFFVLFVSGFVFWWTNATEAPGVEPIEKRFVVVKGSSAEEIAEDLYDQGLIKSKLAFKVYVQFKGLSKSIPPGEFNLKNNLSLFRLVNELLSGPSEFWVTIPEGLRREQYPMLFIESLDIKGERAEEFVESFLEASAGMEGYLFPDTYLFPGDVRALQVVEVLRNTFDKKFDIGTHSTKLSLDEIVTLASIVERETRNFDEREDVAGVYVKRIESGWTLDADATVQYAVASERCRGRELEDCDWWPRPLTKEDLGSLSIYNTYKYAGLPPSPIANPGLSSLEAVLNYRDNEYWFYVHDLEGNIHFAKTLEEHNDNVDKYLR